MPLLIDIIIYLILQIRNTRVNLSCFLFLNIHYQCVLLFCQLNNFRIQFCGGRKIFYLSSDWSNN